MADGLLIVVEQAVFPITRNTITGFRRIIQMVMRVIGRDAEFS